MIPNSEATRSRIVPSNRRYPVAEVVDATKRFADRTGRTPTIEYCLLAGVNDSAGHAAALAALLGGFRAHVNLIPYNATDAEYQPTPPHQARAFRDRLTELGLSATIRATRGRDIAAACGQLAAAR